MVNNQCARFLSPPKTGPRVVRILIYWITNYSQFWKKQHIKKRHPNLATLKRSIV
ncbi:hypothetical protein PGB90_005912 [Kerria lacca]